MKTPLLDKLAGWLVFCLIPFYLWLVWNKTNRKVDHRSVEIHKQLSYLNKCSVPKDCSIILGAANLRCFYFIGSIYTDTARNLLKENGTKMTEHCADFENVSGVTCSNHSCIFGEGDRISPIKWN